MHGQQLSDNDAGIFSSMASLEYALVSWLGELIFDAIMFGVGVWFPIKGAIAGVIEAFMEAFSITSFGEIPSAGDAFGRFFAETYFNPDVDAPLADFVRSMTVLIWNRFGNKPGDAVPANVV